MTTQSPSVRALVMMAQSLAVVAACLLFVWAVLTPIFWLVEHDHPRLLVTYLVVGVLGLMYGFCYLAAND
jgi:hypothetical protein